jgi:hypothetical protein
VAITVAGLVIAGLIALGLLVVGGIVLAVTMMMRADRRAKRKEF